VKRKGLDRSTKLKLEWYYGPPACVIDGSPHFEYHHLDDDKSNTTFANMVPLGATWNCPILRDAKTKRQKEREFDLPAQLDPTYLVRQAAQHFSQWKVAQAYGCARLAHFIAVNYLAWSGEQRVGMASDALYYARQSLNYELIADVLKRDFEPIVAGWSGSYIVRTAVATDLAGILSEHGLNDEASSLYEVVPRIVPAGYSTGNEVAIREAALLRRKALGHVALCGLTRTAESMLREAQDANPNSQNTATSLANTRAWSLIADGHYDRALEVLEPFFRLYRGTVVTEGGYIQPNNVSGWNVAEVFHSYSVANYHLWRRGSSERGAFALRAAERIYRMCHTGPFPLRKDIWSEEGQFHQWARQKGIANVKPVGQLPPSLRRLISALGKRLA